MHERLENNIGRLLGAYSALWASQDISYCEGTFRHLRTVSSLLVQRAG